MSKTIISTNTFMDDRVRSIRTQIKSYKLNNNNNNHNNNNGNNNNNRWNIVSLVHKAFKEWICYCLSREETTSAWAEEMWMLRPHLRRNVFPQCWKYVMHRLIGQEIFFNLIQIGLLKIMFYFFFRAFCTLILIFVLYIQEVVIHFI